MRYDVVGWSGPSYVKTDYMSPDALVRQPAGLLVDRRGEALIPRIVKSYPYANEYRTWPGPKNGNTFVAHVARSGAAELRVDLPPTAIGKDYMPLTSPFGRRRRGAPADRSRCSACSD